MPSGEVTGIEKASSPSVLLRHCVFPCAVDFDFAPGQAAQKDMRQKVVGFVDRKGEAAINLNLAA
jgi:hypothetical protein